MTLHEQQLEILSAREENLEEIEDLEKLVRLEANRRKRSNEYGKEESSN